MKLYHIDRCNYLNVGDEINLKIHSDIICANAPLNLQEIVNEMFPNGVSYHGEAYFLNKPIIVDTSQDIELTFELIRRYKYPNMLSRFESFFAIDKETIIPMINRLNCNINNIRIYEVEAEIYSRHDMNLLIKSSNIVNTALADLYWKGETIYEPLYEYLLKPPVKILRQVNLNEIFYMD